MTDDVRVHVASLNTRAATELCVRSMRRTAGAPFVLTVGDCGSTDGSAELLERLEERGWLRLEQAGGPRAHAEWIDGWLADADLRYAVVADSDIWFKRRGWLRELRDEAQTTGAALVTCEALPEIADYVDPRSGDRMRLAARPAPWLMIVDTHQTVDVDASFAYLWQRAPEVPEGAISYDTGAKFCAALVDSGRRWTAMPPSFSSSFTHFGGLSWLPSRGMRLRRGLQRLTIGTALVVERHRG
jgi:hypothetical protein